MEKAGLGGIAMEFAGVGGESLLACLLLLPSCLPFPEEQQQQEQQHKQHTRAGNQKSSSALDWRVHAAARLQYTAIGAVVPLLLQSFFPARIFFPPLPNSDM